MISNVEWYPTQKNDFRKNLVNISSQGEDYKFKYLDNLPVYQFKTSRGRN